MGNDHWLERLHDVEAHLAEVENPRLREVYAKLADHYRAMHRLYGRNEPAAAIVKEDPRPARPIDSQCAGLRARTPNQAVRIYLRPRNRCVAGRRKP